jgi:hypothetical protein
MARPDTALQGHFKMGGEFDKKRREATVKAISEEGKKKDAAEKERGEIYAERRRVYVLFPCRLGADFDFLPASSTVFGISRLLARSSFSRSASSVSSLLRPN